MTTEAPSRNPGSITSGTTIQSVSRASKILLLTATTDGGLSASQVAQNLGLSLPTAYHLLNTLVSEGLLSKNRGRLYVLGPAAGIIADAVMRDTSAPEYLVEPLRLLASRTGETAYLSAWRRGEIRVLATIEGKHAVRVMGIETGAAGNEHARASGKLLLALSSQSVRDSFLDSKIFPPITPNTITERAALETEFSRIKELGFAYDREEYALGVTCISAPIQLQGVPLGAFTVSAPTERFYAHELQIREAILEASAAASRDR